ncbi:Glycosylphosphatidylinositol (GPI) anchor assembly protein [Aspergillus nanangensis]|uniref:Glycosylphosphatidylinositol (GPI) anchor assembly protein n=1 Tax=Aspergillus nanangensis TaxID=2582783 RepID=A0AAD4GSK1_ASPNN|nr:Glycosylphosphatidylinositol (GPI) anchor assembly protein [Aspergillus nanangensis]
MSSPTSPTSQQPPPAPKSPPPASILSTPLAKTYATIHPFLLLTLLAIRFNALVSSPVDTLLRDLLPLAALQLAYVVICLPPAGTIDPGTTAESTTTTPTPTDEKEKEKKSSSSSAGGIVLRPGKRGYRRKAHGASSGARGAIMAKVAASLLSLALTTLLATPVLAVCLVLFGAPLTTHHLETVLCAAHMALLAATGLVYVYGVDGAAWKEVWGVLRPADAVWGAALGTCVGAWFGAVPIPLDWDRPWQAYPITILIGAYIGYFVGSFVGRSSCVFGKRIVIDANEGENKDE